ncbi:MAG: RCC1 repeat-containing protein [Chloroflexi bacterium]|nr:RCC1 repeat-containing protein [Chloroflexota bacterium]
MDYATGNAIFGYTDGTTGGVVQITQRQTWGCQAWAFWGGLGCGVGECKAVDAYNWSIHVGNKTVCAVRADDASVWCWGDNADQQLGDGTTVDSYIALTLPGTNATQVQAGNTACAVRENGKVSCWGDADDGEMGDGTTSPSPRGPTEVSNIGNAASVATGQSFACARKNDNTVWCWGKNDVGQLGAGDTVSPSATPRQVTGLTSATQLDTYNNGGCAVRSDNTVWCWGYNVYGQVGNASTTSPITSPRRVTGLSSIASVSGGAFHNCARRDSDNTVWCWGKNESGQLGINNTVLKASAVQTTNASSIVEVTAGANHSCARASNGAIYCWGANAEGQLGDNTTVDQLTAIQVGSDTNWRSISTGNKVSCAVSNGSSVRCWGDGNDKAVGDNDSTNDVLQPVSSALSNISQATIGAVGGCAIEFGGAPRCWGANAFGELGNNTTVAETQAVPMAGLSNIVQISRAGPHGCALKRNDPGDDTVWCWGKDDVGQVGDGANTAPKVSAVLVSGLSGNFVGVATGRAHSCFLRGDGTVWCSGDNIAGMLGDNSTVNRDTPAQVAGLTDIVQITSRWDTSCALKGDATVWCWGLNVDGQVGDGTTVDRTSAAQVPGLTNVLQVSVAGATTCALKYNGTIWCWGLNINGQVGDNSTVTPRFTPTQVVGIPDAIFVGEGGWPTPDALNAQCAITANGVQWCWGEAVYGQIGDNSTVGGRLSPVQSNFNASVIFPPGMETTTAGEFTHCGVRGDGRVWCWGKNNLSQVGDGTTATPRMTPTRTRGL